MKFLSKILIIAVVAAAAVAVPAVHEEESVVVRDVEEKKVKFEERIERGHPTVKCEELIPEEGEPSRENHRRCHAHCRTLGEMYLKGHCVEGICYCQAKQKQEDGRGHPTMKCELIEVEGETSGPENHKACRAHCGNLNYNEGICVEGLCHCRREEKKQVHTKHAARKAECEVEKCASECRRVEKEGKCLSGKCHCSERRSPAVKLERHPTIKCEHLIPLEGEASKENHKHCATHCRTLGEHYIRGECSEGICNCEHIQQENEKSHPTVKCEHIIPENGKAHAENHSACRAHCLDIGKQYSAGKCIEGVCRCLLLSL